MKIDPITGLVALTLLRAAGLYNRGETAGFLPKTAQQLIDAGNAVPFDPDAVLPALAADGATVADLAARAAELDAREAALAEREAALAGPVVADAAPAADDTGKGAPPKQGGK